MITNDFFGISRRKFSDAELRWLAKAVAKGLANWINTYSKEMD